MRRHTKKKLIFENYETDTHYTLSRFWPLFFRTLRYRPIELYAMFQNNLKKLFYKIIFGKKVIFGKNNFFVGKFKIDILEQGDAFGYIKFGNGNLVRNEHVKNHFEIMHNGKIEIGNDVFLNGVFLYSYDHIKIGNKVMIGWGTEIIDTDAHPVDKKHPVESKPIIIEDNVWISNNVTILKGVKIGKGSVIGARSVVLDNVKPHCFYAGNPAKFIKKIGSR